MTLHGKKAKKSANLSFNFRVNEADWIQFKALCDRDKDSEIPYSEALNEYILFAIKNQVLLSSDDTFADGQIIVGDPMSTLIKEITELKNLVARKDDDDKVVTNTLYIKENNTVAIPNNDTVAITDNNTVATIDNNTVAIPNDNTVAIPENNPDVISTFFTDNQVSKVDPVAPSQTDDVASEGKEFDLTDYLVRPDPLAVDPTDDDPTDKGKESKSILWADNPKVAKSRNQWAQDSDFKAKATECGHGSTAASICGTTEKPVDPAKFGLYENGKKGKVQLYSWIPENMTINDKPINVK